MYKDLDSIAELLHLKEKELDEIQWDDPQDPRIEALAREVLYYREKHNKGEVYEPRF